MSVLSSKPSVRFRVGVLMYEFTSEEFIEIRDRGLVHFIEPGQLPEGVADPRSLQGETVLLNGWKVFIRGVEHYATPLHGLKSPCQHWFGILVRAAQ